MNPFVADPEWGWWIILYFFLGGLAAGCYFLATLIELFGHEEDRPLARIGYRVAFPLVVLCGIFLIVDLERPERFWHMVLQSEVVDQALAEGWPLGGWGTMAHAIMLKWWSPMSIGAQALGIFGLCSFVSLLGTLWPQGRFARFLGLPLVGRAFKVLGCVVGFFIAAYTGALLTATNQPFWSGSDWIAPLFLTSAASTGIALMLLLGRGVTHASRERLERADLWALGLELFIFLVFLASVGGVLPWALATWQGVVLVVGTLLLGLLLPLWLHLGFQVPSEGRITAAAVSALVGGFILRYGIVRVAPALLYRFPHLTPNDVDVPLWHTWEGRALLAATLMLALLIPYVLRRRWRLSPGQTALAGAVSLCVVAAVIAYSFNPAAGEPVLDPVRCLDPSPEFARPRGGGPGASDINRPAQLYFHNRIYKEAAHD
jgi:formate-dependent nitrite reductase membrane component NrfD